MEFTISKQRKEAERMQIEAEAIEKYNKTISESLSDLMIKWANIQVMKNLVTSPNSKIIMMDGKTPMMISDKQEEKG